MLWYRGLAIVQRYRSQQLNIDSLFFLNANEHDIWVSICYMSYASWFISLKIHFSFSIFQDNMIFCIDMHG